MNHTSAEEHSDAAGLADRIEHLRHTQALVGDSSFSEMALAFYREFADVQKLDYPTCEEMLDWLRDQGYVGRGRATSVAGLPQWIAKFHKILRYLKKHPTSTAVYAAIYVWDDPTLDQINGHQSQEEFAASINLEKAAVNNAVMDAMKHFQTKPRKDQRKMESRKVMSTVAVNRLENAPSRELLPRPKTAMERNQEYLSTAEAELKTELGKANPDSFSIGLLVRRVERLKTLTQPSRV